MTGRFILAAILCFIALAGCASSHGQAYGSGELSPAYDLHAFQTVDAPCLSQIGLKGANPSTRDLRIRSWSPNGKWLVFEDGNPSKLFITDFKTAPRVIPETEGNLAVGPDGDIFSYERPGNNCDLVYRHAGKGAKTIKKATSYPLSIINAEISPRGGTAVFSTLSDLNTNIFGSLRNNIVVCDLKSLDCHELRCNFSFITHWSPKGDSLAVAEEFPTEKRRLFIYKPGWRSLSLLTRELRISGGWTWSLDGRYIYVPERSWRSNNLPQRLWRVDVASGELKLLMDFGIVNNWWCMLPSPDGRRVLFATEDDKDVVDVSVLDMKQRKRWRVARGRISTARWSPTGDRFVVGVGRRLWCVNSSDLKAKQLN
jgi:Tol biopolymer transport system component